MDTVRADNPLRGWTGPLPIREARHQLREAQKPGAGVPAYTRWVNRGLARYAAAYAQRVGLGANAVSVLSFLTSLVGLICFISIGLDSPVAGGLLTALLLAAGYVLDSADGQLARLMRRSSLAGEWLDHSLDAVRLPAIHLTVLSAGVVLDQPIVALTAGAFSVAASAHFLSQNVGGLLRDSGAGERAQPTKSQSWLLLPTDPGILCWLFVLWPLNTIFTIAYASLLALNLGHMTLSTRRRWRELHRIDRERVAR